MSKKLLVISVFVFAVFANAAVLDQSAPFGALTLSGDGGFKPYDDSSGSPVDLIAVTDQTGATRTWSVNGDGALVADGSPSADDAVVLTCTHSGGSVDLTIDIIANKYSVAVSMSEIAAAWADASAATALGILVRDGDDQSATRATLAAKTFTSEFVIEPHVWTENSDPRLSTRNALISGITFSSGCSNVTIQGFDIYDDLTGGESEAFDGVLRIDAPSTNITIRQNEIHSRDFEAIYTAGDFSDNLSTMSASRGVTASGTGDHTRIRVNDNWIHDATRGTYGTSWVADGSSNRSEFNDNYILDVYSNFTTFGGEADGLDIFDNRMMHVWAAQSDTTGAIPATSPHSSTGLSFDAPSSGIFNDVRVIGNFSHVGWNRTKLHADNLDTAPNLQATGMKFNDPSSTDAYQNIEVAFNTLVTHGISCEFSGADGIEIYNNTLAYESYSGLTGTPIFYFQGAANLKLYRNISAGVGLGINDGGTENGNAMVVTSDTAVSYLNFETALDTGDLGLSSFYTGDGTKGFDELTIEEALAAYVPKAGTFAMTNGEKLGALGTGYYSGGGSHTAPAYSKPAPASSTHAYDSTVWDGATYLKRSGALSNIADGPAVTIGWQGEIHADVDASEFYFYQNTSLKLAVRRLSTGKIRIYLENASGLIMQADSDLAWTSADGVISWAFSADLSVGRAVFAVNGDSLSIPLGASSVILDDIDLDGATTSTLHASTAGGSIFKGDFQAFFIADEFVDLDTNSGLSQIFATDGKFKDLGAAGVGISAGSKPIVILGGAAAINGGTGNSGDGGAFAITGGTVTDGGGVEPDPGPDPTPSTSSLRTDGSGNVQFTRGTTGAWGLRFGGPAVVPSFGGPVITPLPATGSTTLATGVENTLTVHHRSLTAFVTTFTIQLSGFGAGSTLVEWRDGNGARQLRLELQTDGDVELRDSELGSLGFTVDQPISTDTPYTFVVTATRGTGSNGTVSVTLGGSEILTTSASDWVNQVEQVFFSANASGGATISSYAQTSGE